MKGKGMSGSKGRTSVVLVHGAWADGSSWNDVITSLLSKGLNVLAAPIPLTSLSDDVAALDRALERTDGTVILVAHAYAGAVIAATTNERVQSLVFIAALAPDEGETVTEVFYREKPHREAPQLAPDAHGFIWMPTRDLAPLSLSMRPPNGLHFLPQHSARSLSRAFRRRLRGPFGTKPSWYLVAEEDRMINPATQFFMAQRMSARIRSEKVDHTPLVTAPGPVIEVILEAVASSSA
jgi:pimeloyl-ACP methyl ester carboxylesterase